MIEWRRGSYARTSHRDAGWQIAGWGASIRRQPCTGVDALITQLPFASRCKYLTLRITSFHGPMAVMGANPGSQLATLVPALDFTSPGTLVYGTLCCQCEPLHCACAMFLVGKQPNSLAVNSSRVRGSRSMPAHSASW